MVSRETRIHTNKELNNKEVIEEISSKLQQIISFTTNYPINKEIVSTLFKLAISIVVTTNESEKVENRYYSNGGCTGMYVTNILNSCDDITRYEIWRTLAKKPDKNEYPKYFLYHDKKLLEISKNTREQLRATGHSFSIGIQRKECDHIIEEHLNCQDDSCSVCEGRLSHCLKCGGFEGSLSVDCISRTIIDEEEALIYTGKDDTYMEVFRGIKVTYSSKFENLSDILKISKEIIDQIHISTTLDINRLKEGLKLDIFEYVKGLTFKKFVTQIKSDVSNEFLNILRYFIEDYIYAKVEGTTDELRTILVRYSNLINEYSEVINFK